MQDEGEEQTAPVRTRGPIRDRGSVRAQLEVGVRTRSGTRAARNPAAWVSSRSVETTPPTSMPDLLSSLRRDCGDLPLTLVMHGWGGERCREFLELLGSHLQAEDAVWLLPEEPMDAITRMDLNGAVVLNPDDETDRQIYKNLVGDLAFFPAQRGTESDQVIGWKRRLRAVLVDERGGRCETMCNTAASAGLETYRWKGRDTIEYFTGI